MIGKFHPVMKRILLTAALAIGATGVARADDSSMNPFTGESYAAFNGGYNRPAIANPSFNNAPSDWRQANPNGLSERELLSYSAPGEAWHLTHPSVTAAASDPSFRQTHPNGLSEREFQALSSDAPAWQLGSEPGTAAVAEAPQTPLGERLANFLHRSGVTTTQ